MPPSGLVPFPDFLPICPEGSGLPSLPPVHCPLALSLIGGTPAPGSFWGRRVGGSAWKGEVSAGVCVLCLGCTPGPWFLEANQREVTESACPWGGSAQRQERWGTSASASPNWEEVPDAPGKSRISLSPGEAEGGAPFGARHKSLVGGPGRDRPGASGGSLRKQNRGRRGFHLGQVWQGEGVLPRACLVTWGMLQG